MFFQKNLLKIKQINLNLTKELNISHLEKIVLINKKQYLKSISIKTIYNF
jgi:hypothetical protein